MRRLSLALLLAAAVAGCGKQEDAVPKAPDVKQIGEACSVDCGGGVTAAIQCAEGETPVCDCKATPSASCVPPPAAPAAK